MKILLAMPSFYQKNGGLFNTKRRLIIPITLPYLAALTPSDIEIDLIDEHIQKIDTSADYDLVGLSVLGSSEGRAIEIAKSFRKRGIPVVAGGIHVSMAPDRLEGHVDSLVVGEAELVWKDVINDAKKNKLKPRYESKELCSMQGLPAPRYDLLDMKKYTFKVYPVQTTRGCPYRCKFCEVSAIYGGKYRFRPADEVISEIKSLKVKNIHMVDDNIGGNISRAKDLFRRMVGLNIRWSGLTTFSSLKDEEYVRLAKESGCNHLNLGIESVNPASLADVRKNHNRVNEYKEMLERLDKHKIPYSLNFILGLDGDTLETVRLTMDFCRKLKPPMAFFSMLTPRPGTEIMRELQQAGRIINFDYSQYDWDEPVYVPLGMTAEELKESMWKCYNDFYSAGQILKRFFKPLRPHLYVEFFMNMIYWRAVKNRRDPVSFY